MCARLIDTEGFSTELRRRGIDLAEKAVSITKLTASAQAEDLTLPPNCDGFGRIHHFRRSQGGNWPANPLPIDPAVHYLGLSHRDSIRAQVFQNAICSWRCWYCFVDFDLLSARPEHSAFKKVDELIDCYLCQDDPPPIIDLSGGQPDLVPEWVLWFADALHDRGLSSKVYLWSDDNLSNDYLWRFLSKHEVARLVSYPNYGRVGCFKGFDARSFSFNTKAEPELFARQFEFMHRLIEAGFDVYGYATFTSDTAENLPIRMASFVDRLQEEVSPVFPLRLVPLKVQEFTPTAQRMNDLTRRSMEVQLDAIALWREELEKRFSAEERSRRINEQRIGA